MKRVQFPELTPSQVQVNTDRQDVQGVEINATKKKGAIVRAYARSPRALYLEIVSRTLSRKFIEIMNEYSDGSKSSASTINRLAIRYLT
ncbi:unnamed protein product [Leptosia nina]|uniref:Uncharacterized protein n=1 Tax=Leptosia nina TaxID=320188 RepID=A0AAV1JC64_9NEOP